MKKIILLLTFLFITGATYSEELIIPDSIYDSTEEGTPKEMLYLRKSFHGNFTNSGYNEYIAFYYSKRYTTGEKSSYHKVIIFIVKNNKVINRYNIDEAAYLDYNEIDIQTIKELESVFGQWNGYYYSYDINKNGTNEIILFRYGGVGMAIAIYEFRKDRMISELKLGWYGAEHLRVNTKEKSIEIYKAYDYEDHKNGYKKWTFQWSEQKWKYELVKKEEGVEFKK
jgi:hypothetical protein